jgi:hypothetical protein
VKSEWRRAAISSEAELRFFAALARTAFEASPAPPKLRPEGHDPLGLFGTAG